MHTFTYIRAPNIHVGSVYECTCRDMVYVYMHVSASIIKLSRISFIEFYACGDMSLLPKSDSHLHHRVLLLSGCGRGS